MRRWGQIPEAQTDAWYDETAKKVYKPEIYRQAAAALVADGKAKAEDFAAETDGYRAPTAEFIDGVEYDGHKPNAYLAKFSIGLKGDEKVGAAAASSN
jgi:nitrate/nitrite transport system substrate-binding protein